MVGYEKLEVWQLSMELVANTYKITKQLPQEEMYALSSQMRRSSVSIPSNIAEGSGRQSQKEFVQFLYIALGSACELETQVLITKKLGYYNKIETIQAQLLSVKKMLNSLISSIKRGEK